MIIIIYGTTAEAIKLAPVVRRLDAKGIPYQHWITQQHTESLRKAIPELGFSPRTRSSRTVFEGSRLSHQSR